MRREIFLPLNVILIVGVLLAACAAPTETPVQTRLCSFWLWS